MAITQNNSYIRVYNDVTREWEYVLPKTNADSITYDESIYSKTIKQVLDSKVSHSSTSTDNSIVRFDGVEGDVVKDSLATIDDMGNIITPGVISAGRSISSNKVYGDNIYEGGTSLSDKYANKTHTHSYLPLSGGTIAGPLIADDSVKFNSYYRDSYTAYNVYRFMSSSTPVETVIKTKIKYLSSAYMPVIRIYGYAYGLASPIELKVGFYIYDDRLGWSGAVSMGAWRPEIFLFKYTENNVDYVALGLKGSCYYPGYQVDVSTPSLGSLDSIQLTGWSSSFITSGQTSIIPAVGVDKCVQVSYKSTLWTLSVTAGGTTTAYDGVADKSINFDNIYLPLSGGTMTGTIGVPVDKCSILLRNSGSWKSGIAYRTNGSEAVCFENYQSATSWVFRTKNPETSTTTWSDVTPSLQIKNQKVTINKLIPNGEEAAYNLDVNGTANATAIYENGVALVNKYLQLSGGNLTGTLDINTTNLNALKVKGLGNAFAKFDSVSATTDYFHIYATDSSNSTARSLVLQNGYGNVGIGTETPSKKLDVNGNLNATTIYENGLSLSTVYAKLSGANFAGDISTTGNITANGQNKSISSTKFIEGGEELEDKYVLQSTVSAYGGRNISAVVSASGQGQIDSDIFRITSGSTAKAKIQYNTTTESIDFVFV